MLCHVEGQPLLDTAKVYNFFQICVGFLICQDGKQLAIPIGLMTVLGDDTFRNVKKQHICFHACFLPFGHNPLLVIERYDIVRCKIGHVDVCQTCEA